MFDCGFFGRNKKLTKKKITHLLSDLFELDNKGLQKYLYALNKAADEPIPQGRYALLEHMGILNLYDVKLLKSGSSDITFSDSLMELSLEKQREGKYANFMSQCDVYIDEKLERAGVSPETINLFRPMIDLIREKFQKKTGALLSEAKRGLIDKKEKENKYDRQIRCLGNIVTLVEVGEFLEEMLNKQPFDNRVISNIISMSNEFESVRTVTSLSQPDFAKSIDNDRVVLEAVLHNITSSSIVGHHMG
jgi:hypothetical protein